jgi:hypothetical protein
LPLFIFRRWQRLRQIEPGKVIEQSLFWVDYLMMQRNFDFGIKTILDNRNFKPEIAVKSERRHLAGKSVKQSENGLKRRLRFQAAL